MSTRRGLPRLGPATIRSVSVQHYENFPVASWLCPPAIRPAVVAVYHFARTADDIADEGDMDQSQRTTELTAYRRALDKALNDPQVTRDSPWASVFLPLAKAHQRYDLPSAQLHRLLDAFEQDVRNPVYANRDELLNYCSKSASPIGRILLHLQGVRDAGLVALSDKICSALQLINFWQDLSIDIPRGRVYIPQADAAAHGLEWPSLTGGAPQPGAERALVADLCEWTQATMHEGARLPLEIGGRMGLELRLVVQGGLRVLEKIRGMGYQTFQRRPMLNAIDVPTLLWRAMWMRHDSGPLR
jgi:squalene synthase HpnC